MSTRRPEIAPVARIPGGFSCQGSSDHGECPLFRHTQQDAGALWTPQRDETVHNAEKSNRTKRDSEEVSPPGYSSQNTKNQKITYDSMTLLQNLDRA